MSGCVRNIRPQNYQNLIMGFQVTAKNVGDVFLGTQCRTLLTFNTVVSDLERFPQTALWK